MTVTSLSKERGFVNRLSITVVTSRGGESRSTSDRFIRSHAAEENLV